MSQRRRLPGGLRASTARRDPYDQRLRHYYTRDRIEAIATARGRSLTDETVPPAVTLESLAARVDRLESKLDALSRQRMPRAEQRARIIHPAIEPSESQHSAFGTDELPGTRRGNARWCAQHAAPVRFATIRDWPECATWRTVEDAVAGLRARGYDWTPS